LSYRIIYISIYLFSLLPFWVLYRISDLCYLLVYKVFKYRVQVVQENLKNAFPDKSVDELKVIKRKYYLHLCDLLVESLKLLSVSEKALGKRITLVNKEDANAYEGQKKQSIFLLGHLGNWEWAIPTCATKINLPLNVVYHPLSNKGFDKVMQKIRTRFGATTTPMAQTARAFIKSSNTDTATALVADQTPSNRNNTWLNFLNQDTLVFHGPEKLARKFGTPVFYIGISKSKRGHYTISPELLTKDASQLEEGELTKMFFEALEKDIQQSPSIWLWSHRRWKHKR